MPETGSYLDLAILINGMMDAFLLVITGKLLHLAMKKRRLLIAVMIGEIPVILSYFMWPILLILSKFVTPFLMAWVAYGPGEWRKRMKGACGFWLLSAGLGGTVYALWNWTQFQGPIIGNALQLGLSNLWILPLSGVILWLGQKAWQRWQLQGGFLKQHVYEIEIDFGKENQTVRTKGFVDTGNHLRDPVTGKPVVLLEEELAKNALPEAVINLLQQPWQESSDPWPWIWRTDPNLMKLVVFVPFRSIEQQSWLPGIRAKEITIYIDSAPVKFKGTVALVKQKLDGEGEYQALLHPAIAVKER